MTPDGKPETAEEWEAWAAARDLHPGQELTPGQQMTGPLRVVPDPNPQVEVEGQVQTSALEVDGFADIGDMFDDTLTLPLNGQLYVIHAADPMTGLLCQRLMAVGQNVNAGKQVSRGQTAQLDDVEEADLFRRLLHGDPAPDLDELAEELDPVPDLDASLTGEELAAAVEAHAEAVRLREEAQRDREEAYELGVRRREEESYDPERDVWGQLFADGVDWQRIKHVATTVMLWTTYDKTTALGFWQTGGRPKAQPPQPRAPQDRQVSGKSAPRGSRGGTTNRKPRKTAPTPGRTS